MGINSKVKSKNSKLKPLHQLEDVGRSIKIKNA
jgi:hypothetical protein